MKAIVEKMINEIGKGLGFDSHFIIRRIKEELPEKYDNYVKGFNNSNDPVDCVFIAHGNIGQIINSFDSLVEKQEIPSLSFNVNGNFSKCALWRKIA